MQGIHVPVVTPFTTDGGLAVDAFQDLVSGVLASGASGVVVLGTTGESGALDAAEKRVLVRAAAEICRDRGATLTVGVGGGDTRSSVAALEAVTGADRALVPVPPFVRPSPAGVVAHFTVLAGAAPVPLIVYHVPLRTGLPLSASTLRELAAIPGVAGVKLALPGIDADTLDLLGDPPPDFAILAGDDLYLSPMLALGASGGIVASAHLATSRFVELAVSWRRDLGHALAGLSAALFAEPNPAVIKGVLYARGRIPSPDVRLPLLPASRTAVTAALCRLADLERAVNLAS